MASRRMRWVAILAVGAAAVPLVVAAPSTAKVRRRRVRTATTTDPGPITFSNVALPDSDFGEPSVDVSPAGYVFVTAPGGAGVQMWRSFDGGKTFDHKEIASPAGGGDSEVEFLNDGTGFTADLEISDSAVSRSTDNFNTWTQQSVGIEQDRQWLGHRCNDFAVLAYHDFAAEAELLQRSTDGGKTWDPVPVPVSPNGSAPGTQGTDDNLAVLPDQGANTFSGPVVVSGHDVYVVFAISTLEGNLSTGVPPYGDPEQIVVGISHDDGQTFHTKIVKTGQVGTLAGVIFPWITVDAARNVYVSYAGRDRSTDTIDAFLLYSTDHGETWSAPVRINRPDGGAHIYTTISAGDGGVVNMAWYTSSKPDPSDTSNDWWVDFAQIRNATDAATRTIEQVRVSATPIHHGDICLLGLLCVAGGDRSLLDFFQVQTGPDGVASIAYASNYHADKNTIYYARQHTGRLAGNGRVASDTCPAA